MEDNNAKSYQQIKIESSKEKSGNLSSFLIPNVHIYFFTFLNFIF